MGRQELLAERWDDVMRYKVKTRCHCPFERGDEFAELSAICGRRSSRGRQCGDPFFICNAMVRALAVARTIRDIGVAKDRRERERELAAEQTA